MTDEIGNHNNRKKTKKKRKRKKGILLIKGSKLLQVNRIPFAKFTKYQRSILVKIITEHK